MYAKPCYLTIVTCGMTSVRYEGKSRSSKLSKRVNKKNLNYTLRNPLTTTSGIWNRALRQSLMHMLGYSGDMLGAGSLGRNHPPMLRALPGRMLNLQAHWMYGDTLTSEAMSRRPSRIG